MSFDLKTDQVFCAAIAGLPKVAELIATVPEARRSLALWAARQSYRQTAQTLGYGETESQEWAAAVMSQLAIGKASIAAEHRL